jgi:hypothetical protein
MSDTATEATEATEHVDESTVDDTTSEETTEGQDALGDAGKKALDSMKAERNAARKEAREARRALEELQAKAGKPTEDPDKPDLDAIRAEAEKAALTKANERVLRSEVKAAATGRLADPADAYKFLDLTQFEVDSDGAVDADEIADAIDDLVKSKPYLAAQGGKRFQGSADGGTRKEAAGPTQLTRADMARMSPEQIAEADEKGQFDEALGRK